MRALITGAVMAVAGATGLIAALLRRVIARLGHDPAMMAAMAVGMVAGVAVGAPFGTLFPEDLWPPTVIGSLAGMAAGFLVGLPAGVMGVLEGIMAGLMGGTMGAMMGGMMPARAVPLIVSGMLVTALVAGLTVKLLTQQRGGGDNGGGHGGHRTQEVSWKKVLWWAGLAAVVGGVGTWFALGPLAGRLALGGGHQHLEPVEVTATAREFQFAPTVMEVPVGRRVRLRLVNEGQQEHDLNISGLAYRRLEGGDVRVGSLGFHLVAAAGQRESVEFIPLKAGEYTAFCSVPGHREAGMQFVLRVVPNG